MNKNIFVFFIAILLVISNFSFAQTESPYMDFDPVKIKENAKYTKNFAPNNYDSKVLGAETPVPYF